MGTINTTHHHPLLFLFSSSSFSSIKLDASLFLLELVEGMTHLKNMMWNGWLSTFEESRKWDNVLHPCRCSAPPLPNLLVSVLFHVPFKGGQGVGLGWIHSLLKSAMPRYWHLLIQQWNHSLLYFSLKGFQWPLLTVSHFPSMCWSAAPSHQFMRWPVVFKDSRSIDQQCD